MTSQDAVPGTYLAEVAGVSDPSLRVASPETVWRGQRNQFVVQEANKTSRLMMGLGALIQIGVLSMLLLDGAAPWRVAVTAAAYALFLVLHRFVLLPLSDPSRVDAAVVRMTVGAQIYMVASATLTGGIHSPFMPSLVTPSIISLLFFGPYPVARWTALANGLLIFAMVSLPDWITGPRLSDPYYTIAILLQLGWFLFMAHLMVAKLSDISARTGDWLACVREERVSEAVAHLRRLQSVGAKVAHELKNPLASIKGLCQLVARTPESERTQERLAVVASEISRMETILNEYLSFSRPLEDLQPELVDVTALAQNVLDVVAGRAENAGVTLDLDGTPTMVKGDPRRLKEALINLVSNAIEATPSGGSVTIRVHSTPNAVKLEIRDTGRGISAEDLARLGTSFFTTRENGTGLGVVLAQSAITQHGGTLEYASVVGNGTTAVITLPVTLPVTTSPSPEPAPRTAMVEARS